MSLFSDIANRFKFEFIGQIIAVVSGGILTVFLARLLDANSYGMLYLALSTFGIVQMFSRMGISRSAARYVTEYKQTNQSQVPNIIKFSLGLNIFVILIVCILFFAIHEQLAYLIGNEDLVPLFALGGIFVAFATLMRFTRHIFQGLENIKASSTVYALDRGLRLVFAIAFVLLGYRAIGALVGYILASIIATMWGLRYLFSGYYKTISDQKFESGLRKRIMKYAAPLTATDSAGILDKRVDTILVGFFINPVAVSYYTLSRQIIQFVVSPITALGFALSPMYESKKSIGKPEVAAQIYKQALFRSLLVYIPAAAGLILISEPLIVFVFGTEYIGAVPVLKILSIYLLLQVVKNLTDSGLDFIGMARRRAIVKVITAILNFILNIILIPWIGVVGAALATVVTDSIYTFVNMYLMVSKLNITLSNLCTNMYKIIFVSFVMSVFVYSLTPYINGLIMLLSVVIFGIIIWGYLVVRTDLLDLKKLYEQI